MKVNLSSDRYTEDFDLDFSVTSKGCNFSYVYSLCYPNGTPFYIGVGKGARYKTHFQPHSVGENPLKDNIIAKINKEGEKVKVRIVVVSTCRDNLIEVEKHLILQYGRRNINTGILSNMTEGGEGVVGKPLNENQIKSLKGRVPYNKGKTYPKEFSEKVSKSLREHYQRIKAEGIPIATHRKGSKASQETRNKQSKAHKGVPKERDRIQRQALSTALNKDDYIIYLEDLRIWYYVVQVEAFCRSLCSPVNYSSVIRKSANSGGKSYSNLKAYKVNKIYREKEHAFYPIDKKEATTMIDLNK